MVTLYHRPHRLLLSTEHGVAPSNHGVGNRNEANFDTNMVIILAALLCALICALGLNSIVRCALRCSRRLSFETTEEVAARMAGTGVKKKELKMIPVAVYREGIGIPATDCPICLGEFLDGEKVRVLPKCNHGFHVRCIDIWLASHSSCPTCRRSLVELPGTREEDGAGNGNRAVDEGIPPLDVRIKWPNDLYLDGLKVGGILCTPTYRSKKSNTAFGSTVFRGYR